MNVKRQKRGRFSNYNSIITLVHLTSEQLIYGTLREYNNPIELNDKTVESQFKSWDFIYNQFKNSYIDDCASTDWETSERGYRARAGQFIGDYYRSLVKGVPNADPEQIFEYQGKLIFDPSCGYAKDEYCDYSLIEFYANHAGKPEIVCSRFPISQPSKISHSNRIRATFARYTSLGYLSVPFKENDLTKCASLLVNYGKYDPISNVELVHLERDRGGEHACTMYGAFAQSENITMSPDTTIEVPFDVKWTHEWQDLGVVSGTKVEGKELTWTLENSAGYLPKRKAKSDTTGTGSFKISSTGLSSGDEIRVKFNMNSFTGAGFITINVE